MVLRPQAPPPGSCLYSYTPFPTASPLRRAAQPASASAPDRQRQEAQRKHQGRTGTRGSRSGPRTPPQAEPLQRQSRRCHQGGQLCPRFPEWRGKDPTLGMGSRVLGAVGGPAWSQPAYQRPESHPGNQAPERMYPHPASCCHTHHLSLVT